MSDIRDLKILIEEYADLINESEAMVDAWNSDSPKAQACNDLGLLYEKDIEIDAKYTEIKNFAKNM